MTISSTIKEKYTVTKYPLYVDYIEYESGGEICPGEEDTEWPNLQPSYINFELQNIHLNKQNANFFRELHNVSFKPNVGQEVYIVLVRFQTGGTFGITHGAWYIEDIYNNYKQAEKIVESIRNNTYDGKYKPWEGHFEALEDVNIVVRKISQ